MLALTKKSDYAIIALSYMAHRNGDICTAREIAEQFHVPAALLMNVLKTLAQSEVVTSIRGAKGGYRLAQSPDNITLSDIIVAIEGPVRFVQCVNKPGEGKGPCDLLGTCPVVGPVRKVQHQLDTFLKQITLAQISIRRRCLRIGKCRSRSNECGQRAHGVRFMKFPIYMDYNATTPVDPRVLEAMLPYLQDRFGNAASRSHAFGWDAEAAVQKAREQIASAIGATSKEIIWTSGATESNNIAIKGVAAMYRDKGNHIITQETEHKAVIDPCKYLETQGYEVTFLTPDRQGRVSAEQVREAMTDKTILVSIMHGNNEIGTIQPIADIGKLCKEKGVFFHTDACQTFAKLPIDVEEMGIDLLSCSGAQNLRSQGRRRHCMFAASDRAYDVNRSCTAAAMSAACAAAH